MSKYKCLNITYSANSQNSGGSHIVSLTVDSTLNVVGTWQSNRQHLVPNPLKVGCLCAYLCLNS